jgi:uncharacterized protein
MRPNLSRLMCGLAGVAVLSVASPAFAQDAGDPTKAQPVLAQAPLTITTHDGVAHHFSVELAKTYRQQEVGEMYRTSLAPDRGMLFVWPAPQDSDMWMRHTLIPLDIVFIDPDGRIHAIAENAVPQSEAHISSHGAVGSTLELAGGVTEKLGIEVGDRVTSSALAH